MEHLCRRKKKIPIPIPDMMKTFSYIIRPLLLMVCVLSLQSFVFHYEEDPDDVISVWDAMLFWGIGGTLCIIGGIFAALRERAKVFRVLAYVFLVPGVILALVYGWEIICHFIFFPVFYTATYVLKWLCLLAIPFLLCLFSFGNILDNNLPTVLKVILCIVLGAGMIVGIYFLIGHIDWERVMPTWNLQEDFYNDDWGTDHW